MVSQALTLGWVIVGILSAYLTVDLIMIVKLRPRRKG